MPLFGKPEKPTADATAQCAFCKKSRTEVKRLVAGDQVSICDQCITLSAQVLADEATSRRAPVATLAEFTRFADGRVIGQAAAKRALGAALVAHTRRLHDATIDTGLRVLVVGPRGAGKTTLAKAMCAYEPKLPSYHADASRLTETGYVGENVENLLAYLLELAPAAALAHEGLLFVDGLHHLAERGPPIGSARDISGAEVQRELVRVLDGLVAQVTTTVPRHPSQPAQRFPCDRLLIAGSWTLDDPPFGDEALRAALVQDGMVPELLSRFDRVVAMPRLSAAELAVVLERGLDATRQLLATLGGQLQVSAEAAQLLALAAARGSDGAFALRRPLALLVEQALASGDGPALTIDVEAAERLLS